MLVLRMAASSTSKRIAVLRGHLSTLSSNEKTHFDLLVIGGGSGGIACAKEAGALGAKVCLVDHVTPTPQGREWGLGGTCVNVGCIPKKLMHRAAILGEEIRDAGAFGWSVPDHSNIRHDWSVLVGGVQNYIKSLNWGHRVQLNQRLVHFVNGRASFRDGSTVEVDTHPESEKKVLSADRIVIATGLRPSYPDIPGAVEYGITSDDLFSLEDSPGKTLIIGGSYVALETAGFLNGLKLDVTVMLRSIPLRGFDQQMAALVLADLGERGVTVEKKSVPLRMEKEGEELKVTWNNNEDNSIHSEVYKTVVFATGRSSRLEQLRLDEVGVKVDLSSQKVVVADDDRTTADNIYAIGDVSLGRPELTPPAIQAGRMLARRMFGRSSALMDYSLVPTTVFTPLEYGCVGVSEEEAQDRLGQEGVEVYHAHYTPLEYTLSGRAAQHCYVKVVCARAGGRVLGLHFTGPAAGEVLQGFCVALRSGLTWADLQSSISIHPTCAEEVVKVHITKRSGENPVVTGC